jgi:uncharacterized protein
LTADAGYRTILLFSRSLPTGRQAYRGAPIVKKDLMDILACPMCKGNLELTIDKEDGDEVIEGSLYCARCDERYPISDSIPNLLPPELRKSQS